MLSRVSLAARAAPLSAARPPLPFPSRSHGFCLLPSRQLHALCDSHKRLGPPLHRAKSQKRFNSSGSTSSRSSDLDLPLGVVIGIGLLETGIWLHLWITTVAENRVSELRTELDDVRSKLRDNIRDVNSKIWKESHELRSDLADNVRSVRSELAKIGRQVHEHYLEFIPIQHRVRSVRLSPGDDTETEVRLAGLQREVQAVKWAQVEVPALKQQLAEVPALKHQVVALQARLDKLEKQKMERRRKKEEMANRRLV
ncbi:hypothetical protein NBRC10512_004571 [Rhodotorula toruloides]|uniref:RHTO0S10e03576g1_1 n=2 Tax=Rhodotorula toruloides TaxID=5286 RepID=A0A061BAN4_RHOTO|nr:uncharacterized protein RHTO_05367 [Rhodotorula toruloides NP11]EMS18995.1 hypothetical protein RHTO_05367 [Rhodotorula toruloides NP11]CDR44952.1 RHTO0S10e03576g1_1 [Rhodotorula toruloides]